MNTTISFTSPFLNEQLEEVVPVSETHNQLNEISKHFSHTVITNPVENGVKPIISALGYSYTQTAQKPPIFLLENKTVRGNNEQIPLIVTNSTSFAHTNSDIGNPAIFAHRITKQYDSEYAIITNGRVWEVYNTDSNTSVEDSITFNVVDDVNNRNKHRLEMFVSIFGTVNGFYETIEKLSDKYKSWKKEQVRTLRQRVEQVYPQLRKAFTQTPTPDTHAYRTIFQSILLQQSGVWNTCDTDDFVNTFVSHCDMIHTGDGTVNKCPNSLFDTSVIQLYDVDTHILTETLPLLFSDIDYECLSVYDVGNIHETFVGIGTDATSDSNLSNGEYYTPQNIVSFMSHQRVGELLRRPGDSRESLFEQIESLRIVDPAMGTGNYVFEVMELLAHKLLGLSHTVSNAPSTTFQQQLPTTLSNARVTVLNTILHGVDISRLSVEIANGIAWSVTIDADTCVASERFKCGNSVLGSNLMDLTHTARHLGVTSNTNASLSTFRKNNSSDTHGTNSVETLQRLVNRGMYQESCTDVLRTLADVQTACYSDDVTIPDDALTRFIPVLKNEESLVTLTSQSWVQESIQYARKRNAFHWGIEYNTVFAEKNGFDLVIGNPPYVRIQELRNQSYDTVPFLSNRYQSATKNFDMYPLFGERALDLIHQNGFVSFIHPTNVFRANFGEGYRTVLSNKQCVKSILSFGHEQVFDTASVYTAIVTLAGSTQSTFEYTETDPSMIRADTRVEYDEILADYGSEPWLLADATARQTIKQIDSHEQCVGDVTNVFVGLQSGKDSVYVVQKAPTDTPETGLTRVIGGDDEEWELESELLKPTLGGKHVQRYEPPQTDLFIIVPYKQTASEYDLLTEQELRNTYPRTFSYLTSFEDELRNRDNGKMNHSQWFDLSRPQNMSLYNSDKILTPQLARESTFTIDTQQTHHLTTVYGIQLDESATSYSIYSVLGVLNTSLLWYYLKQVGYQVRGGYAKFETKYLNEFSLPKIEKNSQFTDAQRERFIERSMSMYRSTVIKEERIPEWFLTPPITVCPVVLEELIGRLAKRQLEHGECETTNELVEELVCSLYGIDVSSIRESVRQ